MPLYEYSCSNCGHEFEKIVPASCRTTKCPECSGSAKKCMSAPSFRIKGYSEKNGYSKK